MPSKKRSYREFKQGLYRPTNPAKCLNTTPPEYRSGLEMKLMNVLDRNSNIIKWSSEKVIIPYFKRVEQRMARYFVDFYFQIKIGDVIKEFIVEVKPQRQTENPLDKPSHGNKKKSTILYEQTMFITNTDKWEAAKKWCNEQKRTKNRDIEFIIITEQNIDTILSS
jgi:hypothetical protein